MNLIPTPAGGTHESGLREGLFGAVKSFAELHSLLPKGVKLLPEDVFARASFVLSAKVLDPQFQGQIKERLNSRDAVRGGRFLQERAGSLAAQQCRVRQAGRVGDPPAQARQRSAQKVEKRKSSGVAVLPGKLTDCEASDAARTEVFLVEGDSAGGSAKMGRDKEFQAILPLRKVLNSWEVDRDRLFANNEIHDISVAIGVDPHGPNDTPDLSGLRYGRICILSDADVDGSHIQVLLLTLFYKHFPKLVEAGNVYVAKPPLFRLDVPAQGKRPARKIYCGRRRAGSRAGQAAQGRRARRRLGGQPLQGPGRNEPRAALGNHHESGHAPSAAGGLWRPVAGRHHAHVRHADGQGESSQRRAWIEEKAAELDI